MDDRHLYPHIKITAEHFPRALATRVIEDDGAEYFGAFLNRTSARILIELINRVFRLRTCDIEIDGHFPVPCTQYFRRRCVAPCVESICPRGRYLEQAELLKLFLANDREKLRAALELKIETASAALDFEDAAFFRDILAEVEKFWANRRLNVWLDDAVDTWDVENGTAFLITHRGRRILGRRTFELSKIDGDSLSELMLRFYRFHAPKEVRVGADFPGRRLTADELSRRFGRKVPIKVLTGSDRRITAERAMGRLKDDVELDRIQPEFDAAAVGESLARTFGLDKAPKRIEAFDAAHISGSGLAAARAVWDGGESVSGGEMFWFSDRDSELGTLEEFVRRRLASAEPAPDLIVVDGGKAHLAAALRAAEEREVPVSFAAAVKPPGRHAEVSHFLLPDGRRVDFDVQDESMLLLQLLRDEAHDLANYVHRERRDMLHFYEPLGYEPLVVPIRYDEPGGGAGDLRPIVTRG